MDISLNESKAELTATMIEILNAQGYIATAATDAADARRQVLELLPQNCTIGMGGSVTLQEIGLVDTIRQGNYQFIDRFAPMPYKDCLELYKQALVSDYFISSVNAITKTGELVCMDSTGNRIAALMFGPKQVIIVVGINKIVADYPAAIERIKKIAPLNAARIHHATPCVATGICEDCTARKRICNYIGTIKNGRNIPGRIRIILISDNFGY